MAQDLCKYYKKQRFVTYNDGLTWQPLEEYEKGELYETHSASCGAGVFQYRWVLVNNGYICDGKDRYSREIYQYSEDGTVWYNVFPTMYRKGYLVESNSPFCDNAGNGQYTSGDTEPISGDTICPEGYFWTGYSCECTGNTANDECIVCYTHTHWSNSTLRCECNSQWKEKGRIDDYHPICIYVDPLKNIKCTSTKKILLKSDVDYYSGGWSVVSYTIGDCIEEIQGGAFNGQVNMTNVYIPSSVERVRGMAFANCRSLTSLSFPSSLTVLGTSTFLQCVNLRTVTFEGTVPSVVSDSLFSQCISLTNASWLQYNNITEIGARAFYNCYSLENVTLPQTLTTIGASAFTCNYSLENIEIPSGVTSIGANAFEKCSGLTNVRIDSVGNIPIHVSSPEYLEKTSGCGSSVISLDELITEDTVIQISIDDVNTRTDRPIISDTDYSEAPFAFGFTYNGAGVGYQENRLVYLRMGGIYSTYLFDSSVSGRSFNFEIGNRYLKNLDNDEYLISGDSVSFDGHLMSLFRLCSNCNPGDNRVSCKIKSLKIKKSGILVKDFIPWTDNEGSYGLFDKISKQIFTPSSSCLTGSSVINDYVYYTPSVIGDKTFADCTSLTAVTVNSQNIDFGNNVFSGCTRLLKLTFTATEPFAIDEGDFDNTNECAIFVPCESVNAYKEAWSQYADRIQCNDTGIYYRWVDEDNIYCDGYDEYTSQKQQQTTNGITWTDTGAHRPITLITHYSKNCGYQGDVALTVTNEDGRTRYYEPCD